MLAMEFKELQFPYNGVLQCQHSVVGVWMTHVNNAVSCMIGVKFELCAC